MPGIPNPSTSPEGFHDTAVVNGTAYPYLDVQPKAYRFRILNGCNDRMLNLQFYKADPTIPAVDGINRAGTEVRMVLVPQGQSVFGKASGIPDSTMKGPNMIQIGNESGFLPAPVVLTNTPTLPPLPPEPSGDQGEEGGASPPGGANCHQFATTKAHLMPKNGLGKEKRPTLLA